LLKVIQLHIIVLSDAFTLVSSVPVSLSNVHPFAFHTRTRLIIVWLRAFVYSNHSPLVKQWHALPAKLLAEPRCWLAGGVHQWKQLDGEYSPTCIMNMNLVKKEIGKLKLAKLLLTLWFFDKHVYYFKFKSLFVEI